MFTKFCIVVGIIGATAISYLFLTITVPLLAQFASSTNATITARSNFADYPGLQGALLGSPLWLYFVPAVIGFVLIALVLRERITGAIKRMR